MTPTDILVIKSDFLIDFSDEFFFKTFACYYNKQTFFKKIDNKNLFLFEKFLKLLFKDGLKLKFLKMLFFSLNFFFYLFIFNTSNFFKRFQAIYNVYYFFSKTTNFFFSTNYIFNWIVENNESIFGIKCESVPKKYRKKLKKRFTFKISYTYPAKRKNLVLRWFYLLTGRYFGNNFRNRVYFLLVDTFFKGKKSVLYLKKLNIYKKVFFSNFFVL